MALSNIPSLSRVYHLQSQELKRQAKRDPTEALGGPHTLLSGTAKSPQLATSITNSSWSLCNPQDQCALFITLPAELRLRIFEFATAPYDDENHKHSKTDPFYRPVHRAKPRSDTSSLLTCRRIWLETNSLPIRQSTATFWFGDRTTNRPLWTLTLPPFASRTRRGQRHRWLGDFQPIADYGHEDEEEIRFIRVLESLTPNNIRNLKLVHLFTPIDWLTQEKGYVTTGAFPGPMRARARQCLEYLLELPRRGVGERDLRWPGEVIFTVSKGEWEKQVGGGRYRMGSAWVKMLLTDASFKKVKTFKLEFAVVAEKAGHLIPLMEEIRRLHASVGGWRVEDEDVTGTMVEVKEMGYQTYHLVWQHRFPDETVEDPNRYRVAIANHRCLGFCRIQGRIVKAESLDIPQCVGCITRISTQLEEDIAAMQR